jgi:hypothetical protein
MLASRGMGIINPNKMPKAKVKKRRDNTDFTEDGQVRQRRDNTDFTEYAEGGPVGLYANINAKRRRGAKMRKPGQKGAPTAQAFIDSAKTAKK